MNAPPIRLPGSPNAARWGATDSAGRDLGNLANDAGEVTLMKTAALLGHLPQPAAPRPSRAEVTALAKSVAEATTPAEKEQASTSLALVILKAAMSSTDTLPPGVARRSQLDDGRVRNDDEAHRIPRFDPKRYAPSLDGIKARGVSKTTPGAGGRPYIDQGSTGGAGLASNAETIEKAAERRALLALKASGHTPVVKSDGTVTMPSTARPAARGRSVTVPITVSVG